MNPRCTALREQLESTEPFIIVEAHNGLSARLVEEAGVRGGWASGWAISAGGGVRGGDGASWNQVLEVGELMANAATAPILMDGDTGCGDFNNLRRFVRKAERAGVAGVCIEDKCFPKANSRPAKLHPSCADCQATV